MVLGTASAGRRRWHRVGATRCAGPAAQKPTDGEPQAVDHAVGLQGLQGVVRAGGPVAAAGPPRGADLFLVEVDRCHEERASTATTPGRGRGRCLLAARADRLSRDGPRSCCGPQPPTRRCSNRSGPGRHGGCTAPSSSRRSARPVGPNGRARARAPRRRPRMITMGATATRAHCPTVRPDRGGQNRGRALSPWSDDSCRCPAVCAADRLTSGRLVAPSESPWWPDGALFGGALAKPGRYPVTKRRNAAKVCRCGLTVGGLCRVTPDSPEAEAGPAYAGSGGASPQTPEAFAANGRCTGWSQPGTPREPVESRRHGPLAQGERAPASAASPPPPSDS